jgi:hypothetical protein
VLSSSKVFTSREESRVYMAARREERRLQQLLTRTIESYGGKRTVPHPVQNHELREVLSMCGATATRGEEAPATPHADN